MRYGGRHTRNQLRSDGNYEVNTRRRPISLGEAVGSLAMRHPSKAPRSDPQSDRSKARCLLRSNIMFIHVNWHIIVNNYLLL